MDTLLALGGPRATVASVSGKLYRVPQGVLKPGATIGEDEVVRTGPGSRAVLTLADGSLVDVNERTELSVHAAWSGKVVHLQRGDVIIQAAKQRHGYLRVQTRDSLASVKGTVFAVSSGISGSLVSVVEGSVAVAQLGSETLLSPGEQAASNQALVSSVQEAVSWSPDAETYLGILASLAHIEKQIAGLAFSGPAHAIGTAPISCLRIPLFTAPSRTSATRSARRWDSRTSSPRKIPLSGNGGIPAPANP